MFLSWLLLASSAALFLTVGSQGPCVPANCSAAMGDLPPLCICDENCTEFAEDCCGPQHLHERGAAEGQATNGSLVCGSVYSNLTPYTLQPLPTGIIIVSWVSYSLSILGGVFILLTHSLFKELRTLSGILLMNLSVAIIMLNFSVTMLVVYIPSVPLEVFVTFFVYFTCSEFAWMTLLSVQMTRSLYQAWRLIRPSQVGSKWWLILVYMLLGWGLPLVAPIGVTVRVNLFLVLFLPLLCLLMVLNLCLLVIATVFLCLFSRHRRQVRTHSYYSDLIRLWVAFFAITLPALTLLLSLLSILFKSMFLVIIRIFCVHVILSNAFVVVISFAFLCTKKVLKLYRDLFTCTSRNARPAANPVLPVRSPDEGCGPLSPNMPNIREGKTPTPAGDGETSTGEGETPTGEGENFIGVLEDDASTGEGETQQKAGVHCYN